MSDAKPHDPVRLNVLPNSGKVDQLRDELMSEQAAAAADKPKPLADRTPIDLALQSSGKTLRQKLIEGKVIEACRRVFDPEIPVNIYELGLIYEIDVREDASVKVKMTLTAPACPVAGSLPGEVERRIEDIPEIKSADVELVWDPPWTRDRMSEAAMLQLGFF